MFDVQNLTKKGPLSIKAVFDLKLSQKRLLY